LVLLGVEPIKGGEYGRCAIQQALRFEAKVRKITDIPLVISFVPIRTQFVQMVPNGLTRSLRASLEGINHHMMSIEAWDALTLREQLCLGFPEGGIVGAANGGAEAGFFLARCCSRSCPTCQLSRKIEPVVPVNAHNSPT
jgi:hypothetical protein